MFSLQTNKFLHCFICQYSAWQDVRGKAA